MKPKDIHIWEKYIRANPNKFLSCDYDVPVGETPDWLNDEIDSISAKQGILYRKKIDVVAYSDDVIYLIEVKPNAGSSALGQILGYDILYRKDYPNAPRTVPMVITNQCQNGYREIFGKMNVQAVEAGICEYCR
jgi:hypothetical protein